MKNFLAVGSLLVILSGCAAPLTTREKGALAGGALGAGAGALIGSQLDGRNSTAKGALIGGALGALGGGLIGDQMYGQEQQQRLHDYELEAQRREIERQRRELEELRRGRSRSDRHYDRYDRDYWYDDY
ncbi:MAG: YMGG-like glycine zipper-containing protein [Candidatus Binatia bacterium]|nr:YMGG-like glycine zipper-containing protein [Candidatus Binatia bacterium]